MIRRIHLFDCMHDSSSHFNTLKPIWQALEAHHQRLSGTPLSQLFLENPDRAESMSLESQGLFFDYSKQTVDAPAFATLIQLAQEAGVESTREAMFSGQAINCTELRTVLHTALRDPEGPPLTVDGQDIRALVKDELERLCAFASGVRQGTIKANDGGAFTEIVNVGIGGSDLGPKMVVEALRPYVKSGLRFHFLSNPDSQSVKGILDQVDPQRTLFVVSSKTFTTQDTLANFYSLRSAMAAELEGERAAMRHFVALTANPSAAQAQGFAPECIFKFWDWVGGRYSMWSAIGLPILIGIGSQQYHAFLEGARGMDEHFRSAPLHANMPVLSALTGIWNHSVVGDASVMLALYDSRLQYFAPYVQQLDMESNGKCVDRQGCPLQLPSGPIVWGGLGINGQHAYFQLVHQGTQRVPVEFIGVLRSPDQDLEHQRIVFSNMLAQAEALMRGRTRDDIYDEMVNQGMEEDRADSLASHRTFPGNIPSTTLLMDELTPARLGSLAALYEHKIFVQGVIWGINSFDQWGVELGKALGRTIYDELCKSSPESESSSEGHNFLSHDPSTRALIARVFNALR